MWYPDDIQHLATLSERLTRWARRWAHGEPRPGRATRVATGATATPDPRR